jgi:hypothetical protein
MQLGEGELAGPVDGHEQMKLALLGPHLGDVDVEEADGVGLERRLRLRSLHLRQPADLMALQATMKRGARQMRKARLERVGAVIERQ